MATTDSGRLLAGANALAIGSGAAEGWEILQYRDAVLVGPDTYEISMRLRGQLGTDADMPEVWPVGSVVVLLDGAPGQIDLAASARGLQRHYRIGAADLPLDDPSVAYVVSAFSGIGLRPYAPVHLRAIELSGGALGLSWIRRTRVDGDTWDGDDVPLGEERERYRVRLRASDETVLREQDVEQPGWTYSAEMRSADGGAARMAEVAQISARFGAGPFTRINIDG